MADPWRWWDAATIARVTGAQPADVAEHWPLIVAALDQRGLYERDIARGVIATVAIETASTFKPVREAFWLPESWRQANLRYYPFYGRGYVQLTWEDAYRIVSGILGVDLLGNPDRAMEPQIAAWVTAWFWATKRIPSKDGTRSWTLAQLCRERDWVWVRRAVQGGEDGLDRLQEIVAALGEDESTVPTIPYNPDAPVDPQPNDWSCALQSVQWLLRSIGRNPDASDTTNDPWLTSQLVPNIIRPDVGLRNATGEDLAAWITREYGHEMGFTAYASPVRFDDVAAGAGVNPTMIGGRGWNHWSGVRALRSDGQLRLANPADGWKGVGQTMSREQFDALGPFTAVWIDRAGAVAPAPDPVPEPPSRKSVLISEIRTRLEELERIA